MARRRPLPRPDALPDEVGPLARLYGVASFEAENPFRGGLGPLWDDPAEVAADALARLGVLLGRRVRPSEVRRIFCEFYDSRSGLA